MAEKQQTHAKEEPWDKLRKIKAFSQQPNELLDKQRITNTESLMYPIYEHALYALKNVMGSSKNWVKQSEDSHKKDFYGYGNNVIAFCAPRGQGKTSAMLSLSHALEHCDDVIVNRYSYPHNSDEDRYGRKRASRCLVREQGSLWEKTIEKKHFLVMPPIDPTVLDGKESIVNLVLAWLFQEINEAWKKCQDPPERIEKEKLELLKHFQKCRECLARHNSTEDADFSDLIKKSIIFEIKEHLYEIIECYFQVCGIAESDIENYLIIQLDDTDMDMVNAYDVLEDVRKFLSLPKTIVLMATYLRQLRMLVAKHYEDVLSLPHGSIADSQHPIDYMQMAAKYIDKLIPAQQMIHIGSFRNQHDLNGKISIESFLDYDADETKEQGESERDAALGKAKDLEDDLEKQFFVLIQAKTGLEFVKHDTYVNSILPTTLRGLIHLFQLLDKMETPKQDDEIDSFQSYYDNLKLQQRNLVSFEDYLRNDWCYSNLVEADQEIMWKISQAHVSPKLSIIQNLLAKRWEWSELWLTNKIRSNFPPELIKSSIVISLGPKWIKTPEAEAAITEIVGRQLPENQEMYKGVSLQYELKPQGDVFPNAIVSYFDITCLLNEAIHRAESMNDLLLVFAIRTHLSIQLHKLFLSDELKVIGSIIREHNESSEWENGLQRWRNHPRTNAFLGINRLDHDDLNDRIELFRNYLAAPTKPVGQGEIKKRFEELCNLFAYEDYYKRAQAPAGKIYVTDDKTFKKQCFVLQRAVLRVLANHEILRMWLSEEPERFVKCKEYIWADAPSSVKGALDFVHRGKTGLYDLSDVENAELGKNRGEPKSRLADPLQD